MFLVLVSCFHFAQAQKSGDMMEAKKTAISELQEILSQMPLGEEESYGFNNREEFASAEIADHVIIESIGHDSQIEFNRYRFVVSVNGEPKALLSYKKEGTSWIMCGLGAANLVREVDFASQNIGFNAAAAYIVRINDELFKGDFIKFESLFKEEIPTEDLIPMISAKESLIKLGRSIDSSYSLEDVMQFGLMD